MRSLLIFTLIYLCGIISAQSKINCLDGTSFNKIQVIELIKKDSGNSVLLWTGTKDIEYSLDDIKSIEFDPLSFIPQDLSGLENKILPIEIEVSKSDILSKYGKHDFYDSEFIFVSHSEAHNYFLKSEKQKKNFKRMGIATGVILIGSSIALYNGLIDDNNFPNWNVLIGGVGFFLISPIGLITTVTLVILKNRNKKKALKTYSSNFSNKEYKLNLRMNGSTLGLYLKF